MMFLYFKYLKQIKKFTPYILIVFLSDFLVVHFLLVTPLFSKIIFDYAYPLKEIFLINVVMAATLGLFFLEFILNVMSDYLGTYINQSVIYDLTRKLFDKCQRLPLGFHREKTAGDLVLRFTSDIDTVAQKSIETIPEAFLHFYTLCAIVVVALLINFKVTLLVLCSIPVYIIEVKYFSKKEEELEQEELDVKSEYFDRLSERFRSIKTIKAFGAEDQETRKVLEGRRQMNIVAIRQGLVTIISVFANSVTIRIWSVFVAWYMGYLVIHNELSIGEVVALLSFTAMLGEPVRQLGEIFTELKVSMVSFKRLDEIFNQQTETDLDRGFSDLKMEKGLICFDQVSFSYDDEQDVFQNLSFIVAPRTTVAIVGESGSGKSTLISLLLRFYSPQSGAVLIDGQKVSDVAIRSLRDKMGLVQQDFTLFKGSIRENIMYGCVDKSEDDLIRAAKQAQIYDFIRSQKDGFETQIGFDGEGLSEGQKQRVAIARVFVRDPEIIIFDEATSALDAESEYKITQVINGLMGRKNLFIIAHRLSTIKKADVILMLKEGKVVEQGSFETLLDRKGEFFRYYSMQFGGFDVFKKLLEIEYERVSRYKSKFNLVCVESLTCLDILKMHDEQTAQDYIYELSLVMKKLLRKGDHCACFYNNLLLILLPEIDEKGVEGFFKRLDDELEKQSIPVRAGFFKVNNRYAALHVTGTPFKVVDDLVQKAVLALKTMSAENQKFTINRME